MSEDRLYLPALLKITIKSRVGNCVGEFKKFFLLSLCRFARTAWEGAGVTKFVQQKQLWVTALSRYSLARLRTIKSRQSSMVRYRFVQLHTIQRVNE